MPPGQGSAFKVGSGYPTPPVKTLPSLAVGENTLLDGSLFCRVTMNRSICNQMLVRHK